MTYVTESEVRNYIGFLIREEFMSGKSGSTLTLSFNAFSLQTLEKNGTALTEVSGTPSTGEFKFIPGKTINLGDSAVSSDRFYILADTSLSSSMVTSLITKAETVINASLKVAYDDIPWTTAPDLIKELTKDLVYAYAIRSVAGKNQVINDAGKEAKMVIAEVMNTIEMIKKGSIVLIGETSTGATQPQVDAGERVFPGLVDVDEHDHYEYFAQDKLTTKSPRSF